MARTRVFISSTYYDLKYVRSALEIFILSLGYEAVLSESGAIAYSPDVPLDESCYREVTNVDMFVLIIGGRYGAEASGESNQKARSPDENSFYARYESITKKEYQAAIESGIPIYILIERSVNAEYYTFLKNKKNDNIQYAHVDSVNIFHFIDSVLSQARNNPKQTFDRYADIENWLREQWAGLFHDMLSRRSSQKQISSIADQVVQLSEANDTMKRYLEQLLIKVLPEKADKFIEDEATRTRELRQQRLLGNAFARSLLDAGLSLEEISVAILSAVTFAELQASLGSQNKDSSIAEKLNPILQSISDNVVCIDGIKGENLVHNQIDEARMMLHMPPLNAITIIID